jgi:endoglucanase
MLPRKNTTGPLYVDPDSQAARLLAESDDHAPCLTRVAHTPQAIWLTDNAAVSRLDDQLTRAAAQQAITVIVLYAVPDRDFAGGYSAGGIASERDYHAFIAALCEAIGHRQVIAIIEPDAVADLFNPQFGIKRAKQRTSLLQQACTALSQLPNTDLYIDCGHPGWPSEEKLADWLSRDGILSKVTGIALNVSNYKPTEECLWHASALMEIPSGHDIPLVIDCSRNGAALDSRLKAEDAWCNPTGARLGDAPMMSPDRFHAQLWIKRPGESDGEHNSGVPAGAFDVDLCCRLCGE